MLPETDLYTDRFGTRDTTFQKSSRPVVPAVVFIKGYTWIIPPQLDVSHHVSKIDIIKDAIL